MVLTFASPLLKTAGSNAPKILNSLFKNKGVQAGIGLGAIGGGIFALGEGTKQAVSPFPELSPIIVIAVILIILLVVLKK